MTIEDLALTFIRGLGVRGAAHLIDTYGSAEDVFRTSAYRLKSEVGLRDDVIKSITSGEGFAEAKQEIAYCRKHGICMVAATDPEYPQLLRETSDRPHILFVKGNVEALNMRTLSMVGTREMSPSGQNVTNRLIDGLATSLNDLCIVSGLAYGIDAACHRSAINYDIPSIAVLANTLPEVSPAAHRQLADDIIKHDGAIVSELSSQSKQNGKLFIARNRIIAGMSMGVVVVESPCSGGSMATAEIADSYNRIVMAVPGRITDSTSFGTNNLIRSGKARLIITANDIIEDMDWGDATINKSSSLDTTEELPDLKPQERVILDAFNDNSELDLDQLLNKSGYTIGELMMILMDLELKGLVRTLPGQKYEKI